MLTRVRAEGRGIIVTEAEEPKHFYLIRERPAHTSRIPHITLALM